MEKWTSLAPFLTRHHALNDRNLDYQYTAQDSSIRLLLCHFTCQRRCLTTPVPDRGKFWHSWRTWSFHTDNPFHFLYLNLCSFLFFTSIPSMLAAVKSTGLAGLYRAGSSFAAACRYRWVGRSYLSLAPNVVTHLRCSAHGQFYNYQRRG